MGDLILGAILQYMVSASFSCFLWSVKVYSKFSDKTGPVEAARSILTDNSSMAHDWVA